MIAGSFDDDQTRLKELEAENAKLRVEHDLIKTNRGRLGEDHVYDRDGPTRHPRRQQQRQTARLASTAAA